MESTQTALIEFLEQKKIEMETIRHPENVPGEEMKTSTVANSTLNLPESGRITPNHGKSANLLKKAKTIKVENQYKIKLDK